MSERKLSIVDAEHPPSYPQGVKWNIDLPRKTLLALLDEALKTYPDNEATNFLGKEVTYAELGGLIDRAARGLQDQGVKPGDRVGVFMPNTTFHFILFMATLKAGATIVPFDSTYDEAKLKRQIADSGVKLMATMPLIAKTKDKDGKEVVASEFYGQIERLMQRGDVPADFRVLLCPMDAILSFPKNIGYKLFKSKHDTPVSPDVAGRVVSFKSFMKNDGQYAPVPVKPEDRALFQYTGGTTGASKGAVLRHFNIAANVRQAREFMVAAPGSGKTGNFLKPGEERILGVLPYFHVYGMNVQMMLAMGIGAKVIIVPNARDIKGIIETIRTEKPTLVPLVPRHFRAILDEPERRARARIDELVEKNTRRIKNPAEKTKAKAEEKAKLEGAYLETYLKEERQLLKEAFSSVKFAMSGGAALPVAVKEEFEKVTGVRILPGYGMSETSPIISSHSAAAEHAHSSVGFIYPGTSVKLIPPVDANETPKDWNPVPVGTPGEIVVSGDQVMEEYWNRPEESAKVLYTDESGKIWLRTGDVAIMTEKGEISITDRSKDMGVINGENVYPINIETQIRKNPDVNECDVVFVPDKSSGQAAVAFVRFKPGRTQSEDTLRAYFNQIAMPKLEKPKHVIIWPEDTELPKTPGVGKPNKVEMRKIATERLGLQSAGPNV